MPLKGKLVFVSLHKMCPRRQILGPKALIQCRKGCESRDRVGGLQSRTFGEYCMSDGSAWKVIAGRGR